MLASDKSVTRNFYICGRRFETEYLRQLMEPKERIGKILISSKKATISLIEGESEEVKFRLTSGIPGKHNQGGCYAKTAQNKRDEEVNAFLRKVYSRAKKLAVKRWILEGDKQMVKRFRRINS